MNIRNPKSVDQAVGYILGGVIYFLKIHTFKTIAVLLLMISGPLYITWDYVTSYRVQIKEATPAKPISSLGFTDRAFAGEECKTGIIIDGHYWGCQDTTLTGYALLNSNKWLIEDKVTHKVYEVEIPYFRDMRLMKK